MNSPHSWGSSACLGATPHCARHLLPLGCASYSGPASPATKHALSSHEVDYWSRDQMESMQCNGSGPSCAGRRWNETGREWYHRAPSTGATIKELPTYFTPKTKADDCQSVSGDRPAPSVDRWYPQSLRQQPGRPTPIPRWVMLHPPIHRRATMFPLGKMPDNLALDAWA